MAARLLHLSHYRFAGRAVLWRSRIHAAEEDFQIPGTLKNAISNDT